MDFSIEKKPLVNSEDPSERGTFVSYGCRFPVSSADEAKILADEGFSHLKDTVIPLLETNQGRRFFLEETEDSFDHEISHHLVNPKQQGNIEVRGWDFQK